MFHTFLDFPQLEYVKTKIACHNETVKLSCPSPSLLEVKAASFGRAMRAICANGVNADQLCDVIDKKILLKELCDYKTECEVVASEEKFGNDCPEVDKYLNVIYACGVYYTILYYMYACGVYTLRF